MRRTLLPIFAATGIAICGFAADASFSLASAHTPKPELAKPVTQGVNHIGLTVRDLDASVSFFIDGLGWKKVGGVPDYPSVFVTDGKLFVTLWRATDPDKAIPFDRKNNVGLHHLALTVADIETLDAVHERMKTFPGVKIEFGPEPNGGGPAIHMMVYEPSGNRIELAVPGGRSRSAK